MHAHSQKLLLILISILLYLQWAEAQKQCNRLKLTDLLVKPMQRLTKYSLLLQAILKTTDDNRQRRHVLEMVKYLCIYFINLILPPQ